MPWVPDHAAAGALAATGVLRGMLYGVEPFDVPTLLLVCGLMALRGE